MSFNFQSELMPIVDHRWHRYIYKECYILPRSEIINFMEDACYTLVDGCIDECKLMHREELIPKITREEILRCIPELSKPLRTNNEIKYSAERVKKIFEDFELTEKDKKEIILSEDPAGWCRKQNWLVRLASSRPWNIAEYNEIKYSSNSLKYILNRCIELVNNNTTHNNECYDVLDKFYSKLIDYNVPRPLIIDVDYDPIESTSIILENLTKKEFSDEEIKRALLQFYYNNKDKPYGTKKLEPLVENNLDEESKIKDLLYDRKLYETLGENPIKFTRAILPWVKWPKNPSQYIYDM